MYTLWTITNKEIFPIIIERSDGTVRRCSTASGEDLSRKGCDKSSGKAESSSDWTEESAEKRI